MPRLLVINPNTSTSVTALLQQHVQMALGQAVDVQSVTARFGAPYISSEATYAVANHSVIDAWAATVAKDGCKPDAVLIGCFGDPGLFALREGAGVPVGGLAEAAFSAAARVWPLFRSQRHCMPTGTRTWLTSCPTLRSRHRSQLRCRFRLRRRLQFLQQLRRQYCRRSTRRHKGNRCNMVRCGHQHRVSGTLGLPRGTLGLQLQGGTVEDHCTPHRGRSHRDQVLMLHG